MAPAPHQSPWRQARSVSPASFAAYAASLLLWQQRTAGKDGDGSEYRIGLRLWVLEERRNPPFCLLLLFGPVSLSCGSVVLNLPFFVSHSSLQPFTHISDFVLNLHAPCLPPHLDFHGWEDTHILKKLQRQALACSLPFLPSPESGSDPHRAQRWGWEAVTPQAPVGGRLGVVYCGRPGVWVLAVHVCVYINIY